MTAPEIHFVISAPRSGSTWLTTALNQHPEIFATEHRLFGDFCEVWQNNDGSSSPRITFDSYAKAFSVHYFFEQLGMNREQFLETFQKSFVNYLISFASRKSGKRIILDKITPYPGTASMVVGKIRELFPQSKIIQLVRDGRDVLTSGTYDWLLKDAQGTDRYKYHVESQPGFQLDRFFDDAVIEKWAGNWKETLLPFNETPADVRVTYEAMKQDLVLSLKDVFRVVGAFDDGAVAGIADQETRFKKMTGREVGDAQSPTAKARKGIAGDWKRHFTVRDGRIFHEIAGAQLIQYGYESDPHWFQSLPRVLGWRR